MELKERIDRAIDRFYYPFRKRQKYEHKEVSVTIQACGGSGGNTNNLVAGTIYGAGATYGATLNHLSNQSNQSYQQQSYQQYISQIQQGIQSGSLITTASNTGTNAMGTPYSSSSIGSVIRTMPPMDVYLNPLIHMLAPISIPPSKLYKVPIQRRGSDSASQYAVWIAQNTIVLYTDITLPDAFKGKLAMVHNHPKSDEFKNLQLSYPSSDIQMSIYTSTYPPDYDEIGWRVSRDFYCIPITMEELQDIYSEAYRFAQLVDEKGVIKSKT